MASDSFSQESLDHDDLDVSVRKVKSKSFRTRNTPSRDTHDGMREHSGDRATGEDGERESPSRAQGGRAKDKRSVRPSHFQKGKTAKDKRKLREKRRSTGVVHLPSTESTGDSQGEDDETKKNTSLNSETGPDDDNPQTPVENNLMKQFGSRARNKSPSQTDLEADLEDNQDYDSTVSQSESNLTTIGQSETVFKPIGVRPVSKGNHHIGSQHAHSSHYSRDHNGQPVTFHRLPDQGKTVSPPVTEFHRISYTPKYKEISVPKIAGYLGDSSFTRKNTSNAQDSKLLARNQELEKLLEKEREENRHLHQLLAEKDASIRNLENEVALMNKDLDILDEENEKLHEENKALIRAMSTLGAITE